MPTVLSFGRPDELLDLICGGRPITMAMGAGVSWDGASSVFGQRGRADGLPAPDLRHIKLNFGGAMGLDDRIQFNRTTIFLPFDTALAAAGTIWRVTLRRW